VKGVKISANMSSDLYDLIMLEKRSSRSSWAFI
jgi:hypothetical protein